MNNYPSPANHLDTWSADTVVAVYMVYQIAYRNDSGSIEVYEANWFAAWSVHTLRIEVRGMLLTPQPMNSANAREPRTMQQGVNRASHDAPKV